jgi:hypothetical protein
MRQVVVSRGQRHQVLVSEDQQRRLVGTVRDAPGPLFFRTIIFVGQADGFEKRGQSRIDTRAWTLCRHTLALPTASHSSPESHTAR